MRIDSVRLRDIFYSPFLTNVIMDSTKVTNKVTNIKIPTRSETISPLLEANEKRSIRQIVKNALIVDIVANIIWVIDEIELEAVL